MHTDTSTAPPPPPSAGMQHARPVRGGPDYTFGRFALYPARKLLVRGETPVPLGGRAFDLLVALIARAGEVVSHHELVVAVWPHSVVEENGLRVHMSAMRKALGENPSDQYILTLPGRGYRFVKSVAAGPLAPLRGPRPGRLVGRAALLERLASSLAPGRVTTLVGAGGSGKTALAHAAAQARHDADGCQVVDCAGGIDPAAMDWRALRERQSLLVLDNCEAALPAAAAVAARLAGADARVTVLATSRAPLGVAGERVVGVPPLDVPAPDAALDCRQALAWPAIALFVERAEANSSGFALTPANLACVAALCRQLDGLPLALELAAARVEALGVEGLAARLDDLLLLLTRSRRLAGPRHASLGAMLDASHRLLDEAERTLLRRLSVFAGAFAPKTALRVCAFGALGRGEAGRALAGLAACSLLVAEDGVDEFDAPRYRLLNTTRRYAAAQLAASGEAWIVAERLLHTARDDQEQKQEQVRSAAWE
ncbi:winged helix-turn-helix domain-containing protein [Massilia sp. CFBP9026]|uniref:winged helix-turn-helix domain-containing protein n=1 Tax=Massilia sp. CFBP9026 TaxID=3096536 RepID=UPI002A69D7F5|nr:winged helix-turn-helix domain-containing protein [Massilia sp. CFBP9026]MDY0961132.1 winged helix-turn-helix domain-containing protein [Massilia sp. CFBP9026]